jgi:NTP pyrophosphatase (non-canonical NTP hydrolase)
MTNTPTKFSYIEEAHVTASPHFYGEKVPLSHFFAVLNDAIAALNALDQIKKTLFYGKELGKLPLGTFFNSQNCGTVHFWLSESTHDDEQARNIIHAIIGKATEAGELLEALQKTVVHGETFDKVNAAEEIGDGFWYDALLAKACGLTFEEIQKTNIAKLRKRFADRFTEYDAQNRNLSAEREVLGQIYTEDELFHPND